jgi:hypothetical protein
MIVVAWPTLTHARTVDVGARLPLHGHRGKHTPLAAGA